MFVDKMPLALATFLVSLGSFVMGLFAHSLSTGPSPAPARLAPPNFTVGAIVCLTGDCAEVGTNSRRGMELAAEEINSAGGILGRRIALKVEDTREMEGPGMTVAAYQNLVLDPEIRYLVGPTWTVGGLPLAPILAKRPDIIAISPSLGVAAYNEAADTIFNTWPHDDSSTEALADYAFKQGWRKAAVLSDQSPWESAQAEHFIDTFKKLGGQISIFLEPSPEVRDLRTEVSKIKRSQSDFVFMSNYTTMDLAAKELRIQQVTLPKMAILLDDIRLKNSEGALEGLLYAQYPSAKPEFAERFRAKYHDAPGMSADTAYDSVKILAAAITRAGSFNTDAVKTVLHRINFEGASGAIHFDEKGGVRKAPDIYAIKGGQRSRVGAVTDLLAAK